MKRLLSVLIGLSFVVACNLNKRRDGGDGAGDSALSAIIDGIDPEDRKRGDLQYAIRCNIDTNEEYKLDGKMNANQRVEFSEKDQKNARGQAVKLKVGDPCAIEIRSPRRDKDIRWLAVKNNQPDVGLAYTSNIATVGVSSDGSNGSKLVTFTVYKTYSDKVNDPYRVKAVLKFPVEQGIALNITGMIASLECQGSEVWTYSGNNLRKVNHELVELSLDLSVNDLRTKGVRSCNRLTILKDNFPHYEAVINAIDFSVKAPVVGGVSDLGQVVLTSLKEVFGVVECSNRVGNKCVSLAMPNKKLYWYAQIDGVNLTSQNAPVQYLVTAKDGINSAPRAELSLAQIIADLKASENTNQMAQFAIYPISEKNKLAQFKPGAPNNLTPNAVTDLKVLRGSLLRQDGTSSLLAISEMGIHGIKTVSESVLNAAPKAHWLTKLRAKNGAVTREFLVAGGANLFYSAKKALGNRFFSVADFQANPLNPDNRYKSYAYTGSSHKPAACNLSLNDYVYEMGSKNVLQILQNDDRVKACEISDENLLKEISGNNWQIDVRFLMYGPHVLKF